MRGVRHPWPRVLLGDGGIALTMLRVLRIEVDGHFHGGPPVRPWVARIEGPSARWGLRRTFDQPHNDWAEASVSWRGNVYGVVATFTLRDGAMYEVARCRGRGSRRHVLREFFWLDAGERRPRDPDEVLRWVIAIDGPASILRVREDVEPAPWVMRVGAVRREGFVLVGDWRRYLLRDGTPYEVHERDRRRVVVADNGRFEEPPP